VRAAIEAAASVLAGRWRHDRASDIVADGCGRDLCRSGDRASRAPRSTPNGCANGRRTSPPISMRGCFRAMRSPPPITSRGPEPARPDPEGVRQGGVQPGRSLGHAHHPHLPADARCHRYRTTARRERSRRRSASPPTPRPFNYLGLPSMSIPCGFDPNGLADRLADQWASVRGSRGVAGRPTPITRDTDGMRAGGDRSSLNIKRYNDKNDKKDDDHAGNARRSRALPLNSTFLAKRAGLAIPEDRKAALFAGFKDLRRMLATMRQPRTAADEPAGTFSIQSVDAGAFDHVAIRNCSSSASPTSAASCATDRSPRRRSPRTRCRALPRSIPRSTASSRDRRSRPAPMLWPRTPHSPNGIDNGPMQGVALTR